MQVTLLRNSKIYNNAIDNAEKWRKRWSVTTRYTLALWVTLPNAGYADSVTPTTQIKPFVHLSSAAQDLLGCMTGKTGTGCDGTQAAATILATAENVIAQTVADGHSCGEYDVEMCLLFLCLFYAALCTIPSLWRRHVNIRPEKTSDWYYEQGNAICLSSHRAWPPHPLSRLL